MKITIESTQEFAEVNGTKCRIWRGADPECVVLVAAIAIPNQTPEQAMAIAKDLHCVTPILLPAQATEPSRN